jgi:hypothetical protein
VVGVVLPMLPALGSGIMITQVNPQLPVPVVAGKTDFEEGCPNENAYKSRLQ